MCEVRCELPMTVQLRKAPSALLLDLLWFKPIQAARTSMNLIHVVVVSRSCLRSWWLWNAGHSVKPIRINGITILLLLLLLLVLLVLLLLLLLMVMLLLLYILPLPRHGFEPPPASNAVTSM